MMSQHTTGVAIRRLLSLALVMACAVLWGGSASASAKIIAPVASCQSLATLDLSGNDAEVLSAQVSQLQQHAYCDVTGIISPQTHFDVVLPTATWQGDYLQQGCGGFCGLSAGSQSVNLLDPSRTSLNQASWTPLLNGELVVGADDQGHRGATNNDALWAKNDPQLRVVFGYTSEHSMLTVAHALMQAFYGRGPAYRYFDGVSDGGHEALDLAQRYPNDFNGILAGAPANNWAALAGVDETWQARANMDASGHQILTSEKLPALHAAVVHACGDAHGVIVDPRACTFDPVSIECAKGTDTPRCLTPAQVTMARREYRGPTTAGGKSLYDGGEPYGSELGWDGWLVQPASDHAAPLDAAAGGLSTNYLKYAAYWRNPPNSFTIRDFPFTLAAARSLEPLGGIYDATDPDLRAFAAHGGKLIIYQGWADMGIPPQTSLDYYSAVIRFMGGYARAQRFSRLYMIPGLYHCPCGRLGGGDPDTHPQFMDQLAAWVEHDQAPAAVTFPVTHSTSPNPPHDITVTPLNPLINVPHNHGLNSNYHYALESLVYNPEHKLWCQQVGRRLVCSRRG
jgi:hypothetical protein